MLLEAGFDPRRARLVLVAVGAVSVAVVALFMTWDLKGSLGFALSLRARKVGALAVVGVAVAHSSVLFQTITRNRILTPSIMGFDAFYLLARTGSAYLFGTFAVLQLDVRVRFAIEAVAMLGFATFVRRWLGSGRDLFTLLLVGIVAGTMFTSLTTLITRLIDPNELLTLQDQLFANFSTVNAELLWLAAGLSAVVVASSWRLVARLDVLALGRDVATNLGVDGHRVTNQALAAIAVLASVATALVGPITFLGLIAANVAYQLTGTFRHRYTIPAAIGVGVAGLVGGQFVLEELAGSATRLSIIVSFVGGLYLIALLLREARR